MTDTIIGEWHTTGPNPRRHRTFNADDGNTGWKLHFVPDNSSKAICGLKAKHGWAFDLHIIDQCSKCEKALDGIETRSPTPEPWTYYEIAHCDTHKKFWQGRDLEEAIMEAGCVPSPSEYYVTEWYGTGRDDDEIIEQISVDEWLHEQKRLSIRVDEWLHDHPDSVGMKQ